MLIGEVTSGAYSPGNDLVWFNKGCPVNQAEFAYSGNLFCSGNVVITTNYIWLTDSNVDAIGCANLCTAHPYDCRSYIYSGGTCALSRADIEYATNHPDSPNTLAGPWRDAGCPTF